MAGWFTREGRRFHADGPTQAAALTARGWTPEAETRPLDDLKVPELRALADTRGVDVTGLKKKADIIAALTAEPDPVTPTIGLTVDHGLHGPVDMDTVSRAVADETTRTDRT